jgi:hypothetical protein
VCGVAIPAGVAGRGSLHLPHHPTAQDHTHHLILLSYCRCRDQGNTHSLFRLAYFNFCVVLCRDSPDIGRIIRPFLYPVSDWIPDLTCRISGRILDTENSRISGLIEKITISIREISKNSFLKSLLLLCKKCCFNYRYWKRKSSIHLRPLFISYFTRHLNVELISDRISGFPVSTGYPAGYPVSGF